MMLNKTLFVVWVDWQLVHYCTNLADPIVQVASAILKKQWLNKYLSEDGLFVRICWFLVPSGVCHSSS